MSFKIIKFEFFEVIKKNFLYYLKKNVVIIKKNIFLKYRVPSITKMQFMDLFKMIFSKKYLENLDFSSVKLEFDE